MPCRSISAQPRGLCDAASRSLHRDLSFRNAMCNLPTVCERRRCAEPPSPAAQPAGTLGSRGRRRRRQGAERIAASYPAGAGPPARAPAAPRSGPPVPSAADDRRLPRAGARAGAIDKNARTREADKECLQLLAVRFHKLRNWKFTLQMNLLIQINTRQLFRPFGYSSVVSSAA